MKSFTSLFLFIILIISCSPKTEEAKSKIPQPEKTTINQNVNAASFIPKEYKQFVYLKDGQTAYNNFTKNSLYTSLSENYLFLDLKYNFSENKDMFFTKFNFDFNSIFKYIESDASFGVTNNGFFLIASMSFKSKVLTSLLNVAPENIVQETVEKGHKIYYINKESASIYYAVVNNYILFSDSRPLIASSLDAAINNYNSSMDTAALNSSELIYSKKIESNKTPFDLFPLLSKVDVIYDTATEFIRYSGAPKVTDKEDVKNDPDAFETLKLIDKDTAIVLYNSEYELESIFGSMSNSENRSEVKANAKKVAENLNGVYFLAGDLNGLITGGAPELGLILNVNSEADLESTSVELTSQLLGVNWYQGEKKGFYESEISDFYLIVSEKNIAVFTKENLAVNYYDKITNKGMSLYDMHVNSFGSLTDTNLNSYICFNPDKLNSSLEGLIKRYLFSNINMDEYEYDKSFGGVLTYLSTIKPGYMDLNYNQESKTLNGSIKTLP